MRRPARPAWEKKLWFWVTDDQYRPLEKYAHTRMTRWEAWGWWWRENLIERPAKALLCLVFGHYPVVNYPKYPGEFYCIKCNKDLGKEDE